VRFILTSAESSEISTVTIFANPFSNHSFLTLLALSQNSKVILFCPPLQLQFLFGLIRSPRYSPLTLSPLIRLVTLLLICSFILYRFKLISREIYVSSFSAIMPVCFSSVDLRCVFVSYQDYLSDLFALHFPNSTRICEIIIATNSFQSNYITTLKSIRQSSVVVLPTLSLTSLCHDCNAKLFVAPYGGNSCLFIKAQPFIPILKEKLNSFFSLQHYSYPLTIVARSNSIRKGADVFLESLLFVDRLLPENSLPYQVNIHIAGQITEPIIKELLHNVILTHRNRNIFRITARQYTRNAFSQLLRTAHLFVMPSRLESSSLAALEALWTGVPSILSPACGIDNFANGRHGLLLSDLKPELLASLILSCIVDRQSLLQYHTNLTQERHLFTWDSYFQAYNTIYRSL